MPPGNGSSTGIVVAVDAVTSVLRVLPSFKWWTNEYVYVLAKGGGTSLLAGCLGGSGIRSSNRTRQVCGCPSGWTFNVSVTVQPSGAVYVRTISVSLIVCLSNLWGKTFTSRKLKSSNGFTNRTGHLGRAWTRCLLPSGYMPPSVDPLAVTELSDRNT
jgi:hypothetical protein